MPTLDSENIHRIGRVIELAQRLRALGEGHEWLARLPAGQEGAQGGVHPVIISGVVGHKLVELAAEVYDRGS